MNLIDPDTPITFRDLLGSITSGYPIKNMTPEEFEATPFTTHCDWHAPQGWEKTGYRSPNSFLVGHDNIVYWVFHEFKSYGTREGDYGQELTVDADTYLIHINGKPVFQRVNAYAKEKSAYTTP